MIKTKKRKYAEGTGVPIGKSKDDITKLLREWGCDQVGWQENYTKGEIQLVFVWTREDKQQFGARIAVPLPTQEEIRKDPENVDKRTGQVNERKVREAMDRQGRPEMRMLLFWLKAAFNAIEAGIISPEVLFMPFFVAKGGRTVSDMFLQNLSDFISGKISTKQLTEG